jgi:hypothetical protein
MANKSGTDQPPRARLVRGLERLLEAIRNVIWYVASGLVVGFSLVMASLYIPPHLAPWFVPASHVPVLVEKSLEHLGMGFIVAAIAVLFYEWGAHIKDSLKLSAELKALREAVAGANRSCRRDSSRGKRRAASPLACGAVRSLATVPLGGLAIAISGGNSIARPGR